MMDRLLKEKAMIDYDELRNHSRQHDKHLTRLASSMTLAPAFWTQKESIPTKSVSPQVKPLL